MNKRKQPIIAIGIDQGIASCGFSAVSKVGGRYKIMSSGTIRTKPKMKLEDRIFLIYEHLDALIEDSLTVSSRVSLGCERLFFNPAQRDGGKGQIRNKSASIVYTNMITGVLFLLASKHHIPIKEYVPGTIKKAVAGHGRASKEQVEQATLILTGRRTPFGSDHESDAVGIAITAIEDFRMSEMIC